MKVLLLSLPFEQQRTPLFKAELIQGVLFNLALLVRKGACELKTRKNFGFQSDHNKFGSSVHRTTSLSETFHSKFFTIKISKISVRDGKYGKSEDSLR